MKETWEEHKKIYTKVHDWWGDNQKRTFKGPYDLNTLKKMHSDAKNRITQHFPEYTWKFENIHSYHPSEEGYGTHYIRAQTEDDETGHNFIVSSYYENGKHKSSIDYGS